MKKIKGDDLLISDDDTANTTILVGDGFNDAVSASTSNHMLRLIACIALILVATLSDAAAQKRGMGGGGLRQTCLQQATEAHPLGTSPQCHRFLARFGRCQTYIRGNVGSAKLSEGGGQMRRCMHGRPDPNLTQFGAANSGNTPPGPGRRRGGQ